MKNGCEINIEVTHNPYRVMTGPVEKGNLTV
jgi:hypothetical protein